LLWSHIFAILRGAINQDDLPDARIFAEPRLNSAVAFASIAERPGIGAACCADRLYGRNSATRRRGRFNATIV
jgi:hypothetical protein